MKINLIATGSLKEDYLESAQDEFLGIIFRKCQSKGLEFNFLQLREEMTGDNPSQAAIDKALKIEGERILGSLKDRNYLIILDIEGKPAHGTTFSEIIGEAADRGFPEIAILIGSSHGLSREIKDRANRKVSFSNLTFPHQLFRIAVLDALTKQL